MASRRQAVLTVADPADMVDIPGKQFYFFMQDKQKVTLYLSPEVYRRLKIRAALDTDSMSEIAERAIQFYLSHSDSVDTTGSHGTTHRIYNCPECAESLVVRNSELVTLGNSSTILNDELTIKAHQYLMTEVDRDGEEVLVPC